MTTLVIADHDNNRLRPATLNTVAAASLLGGEVHVLVAGCGCEAVAQAAVKVPGVARVKLTDASHYATQGAENVAALVVANATGYSHILAPATRVGKDVLPRVAALLDVAQISDVIRINSADTFVRPIYAGSAIATLKSLDPIKVLTVRTTAFEALPEVDGDALIDVVNPEPDIGLSWSEGVTRSNVGRVELTTANVIVSGGRGLASGENYRSLLEPLAEKLEAALGATRAAVDGGYAPSDSQIGQTGKIVAPRLYFAIGISGAVQHLAGIQDSQVIVAINKDPEAPIFSASDYGLVGDLFQLVPELTSVL